MRQAIIILMLLLFAGLNANAQTVREVKLYQDSIDYRIEKLTFNSPFITLVVSDSGATLTDSIRVSGVFDRQEIPLWGLDENNKVVWYAIPGAGETKAFIFYTYGANKIRLNIANVDTVAGRYTYMTMLENQTPILPTISPENISILGGYLDSLANLRGGYLDSLLSVKLLEGGYLDSLANLRGGYLDSISNMSSSTIGGYLDSIREIINGHIYTSDTTQKKYRASYTLTSTGADTIWQDTAYGNFKKIYIGVSDTGATYTDSLIVELWDVLLSVWKPIGVVNQWNGNHYLYICPGAGLKAEYLIGPEDGHYIIDIFRIRYVNTEYVAGRTTPVSWTGKADR